MIEENPVTDFVNTHYMPSGVEAEKLESYNDAKSWFIQKELISKDFNVSKTDEKVFLQELKNYRSLLKTSFKSLNTPEEDLGSLLKETNKILSENRTTLQLSSQGESIVLDFTPKGKKGNLLLCLIAIETAKLLSSKVLKQVKKCHNDACSLYFVDSSKNHSRRWCSMEVCGNRSKVKAFDKRKKINIV